MRDYKLSIIAGGGIDNIISLSTDNLVDPLNLSFSSEQSVGKPSATMGLRLYNLNRATLELLHNENVKLKLSVGNRTPQNPDTFTVNEVFIGSVVGPILTNSNGPDRITTLKCSNGHEMFNIQGNSVFSKLTKMDLFDKLKQRLDQDSKGLLTLDLSYLKQGGVQNDDRTALYEDLSELFRDGYSVESDIGEELRKQCEDLNLEMTNRGGGVIKIHHRNQSEQKAFYAVPKEIMLTNPSPVANTALQNQNDKKPRTGWTFRTLLNPFVSAGQVIRVDNGQFDYFEDLIVQSVRHTGAYRGQEWYTTVVANPRSLMYTDSSIADNVMHGEPAVDYRKALDIL